MPSSTVGRAATKANVNTSANTRPGTSPAPVQPQTPLSPRQEIALLHKVLPADVRHALIRAYQDAYSEPADDAVTALVEGGRTFSAAERADLRVRALAQSFAIRREILADTLSSTQVAAILGTTRQTPLDRVRGNTLLALRDGGSWRFPAWQFDAGGPDGMVPGLVDVLHALQTGPFAKARWLRRPHPELDEQTPLGALQAGRLAEVLPLAARVGAR